MTMRINLAYQNQIMYKCIGVIKKFCNYKWRIICFLYSSRMGLSEGEYFRSIKIVNKPCTLKKFMNKKSHLYVILSFFSKLSLGFAYFDFFIPVKLM